MFGARLRETGFGYSPLIRAVKKHAKEQWMVLYIERWLQAPVQEEDGQLVPREKGTPQGGLMTA